MPEWNEATIPIVIGSTLRGLLVRDGIDYRFVATDPRLALLDGCRFRRLGEARSAAARMVRATSARPAATGDLLSLRGGSGTSRRQVSQEAVQAMSDSRSRVGAQGARTSWPGFRRLSVLS